ncbi:MAG: RNA-binding protein [Proteobacteria bacterium]|nr:RNA-binding protein [Pseudomonadota bacterium]
MSKLYVGNLPWSATEDEVRDYFAEFGSVQAVTIVVDRETGRSRGFGFVEVDDESVDAMITNSDGKEFGGRTLRVDRARERSRGPARDRR